MVRYSRRGNQKKLGIIVAVFFGFILLTSTVLVAVLPPVAMDAEDITGTPQDNYSDNERLQFCGTGQPKSNEYITEYRVPTVCAQPVGIHVTPDGSVWFGQYNTGNLARLNPATGIIQEFENEEWDDKQQSMLWGLDYADGYLWYTDDANDSVWRFDTNSHTYQQFVMPTSGDSLPQVLKVVDDSIIINDLTGNTLAVLDISDVDTGIVYNAVPSHDTVSAVTAGFTIDDEGYVWYTTWLLEGGGLLVRVDPDLILGVETAADPITVTLPPDLTAPNGIAIDRADRVWLADTSSSYFFMYDPLLEMFEKYVTAPPEPLTYGNVTGVVQNPISRPYWMQTADDGRIVFNEQAANRIAVMDPVTSKLVEYSIPSRNPFWADCRGVVQCGISQALTFDVAGSSVWFGEWVENNVGVVDISRPLPFDISLPRSSISMMPGESQQISYVINSVSGRPLGVLAISATTSPTVMATTTLPQQLHILEDMYIVDMTIMVDADAVPGTYKVLLGAEGGSVAVSRYVTVEVLQTP